MSNHNYSQYSNKKNNGKKHSHPNPRPIEPKADVTPEIDTVAETVETVTLPETVEGTIINCAKLNVRAEPNINAEVLCVLDVMSEIEIDVSKSTSEWLKICTATGIDGYCMRKFVDARL